MKNILITGGCGFQGSHLATRLIEFGHNVTILSSPSQYNVANSKKLLKHQIDIVWGSVLDSDLVNKCIQNKDIVFHLAAKINVDESIKIPDLYLKTNFNGTANILTKALKNDIDVIYASTCEVYGTNLYGTFNVVDSVKKYNSEIIFVSSSAIYGVGSIYKMNEFHPTNPHSPYATSKLCADRLCYAYHKTYGLKVKIVRPFNIYGPLQKHDGAGAAIPIFFNKIINGNPIQVNGSGNQTRDYLYIDDIIDAYIIIMNTDELNGKVVNVGSGIEYKIIDIANKIINIVGKGEVLHREKRTGEVDSFIADTTLLSNYGFSPKINIDDGLKKYYNSITS